MHLCKLKTDYMDFGFIHCIDQQAELDKALQGGILEMVQKYKQQGKVRHIGFSSHNPAMVHKVLDIHIVDMVMFSINPAYDYTDKEEYGIGTAGERMAFYRRCEQEGVGISVMKPYGGGRPPPPNPDRGSASECSRIPLQNIRYTPGQLLHLPRLPLQPLDRQKAPSVTNFFGKNIKIAMRTRIRTKEMKVQPFAPGIVPFSAFFTLIFSGRAQPFIQETPGAVPGVSSSIR